jgi:glycerol-3-phosphate dehydrogenase
MLGGLHRDELQAVFQYWDGQTDDAALTRAVVASAQQLGAACLPHCELLAARRSGDRFELTLRDAAGEWRCGARQLVNATGPWVNELLARCEPAPPPRALSWVKGTHIALPAFDLPGIFYLEAPSDGRAVFVMPWRDRTLVGTTEADVDRPDAGPAQAEIDYLLATLHAYFPAAPTAVLDCFAGTRVLPAAAGRAFNRPRESVIERAGAAGALISIYGGKLTTYRHTAEQVVDLVRAALGERQAIADTRELELGADILVSP